jgi:hypothetical protein
MRSAEVNRDPSQYTETDDHYDAELISYLVDVLLIRTAADFPAMYGSSSENAIAAWSIAGMDSLGGWGSLSAEQLLGGMFGLAGLCYGYSSIPEEWVRGLRRGDYLHSLCKQFFEDFEPSHC